MSGPADRIVALELDQKSIVLFLIWVLPPFLRRTRNVEELLPWLYLKGVSTSQFAEALTAAGSDFAETFYFTGGASGAYRPYTLLGYCEFWQGLSVPGT